MSHAYLRRLAVRIPRVFSGASLHRLALEAMRAGELETADRAFEAAARHYRADLAVEPLARLRVHQLMARARALTESGDAAELMLEIEQRLSRLDSLESLTPPFELVEARSLLATYRRESDGVAAPPVARAA